MIFKHRNHIGRINHIRVYSFLLINLEYYMLKISAPHHTRVNDWVIVVQHQLRNFSAIPWRENVNLQWDDDEVCFVLNLHAELDLYSASSLKQQSRIDMWPHSDTLFWFRANQCLLFLFNAAKKQQDEHANHYTTDAVTSHNKMSWRLIWLSTCHRSYFFLKERGISVNRYIKECHFSITNNHSA
jgi:hypothetical protein